MIPEGSYVPDETRSGVNFISLKTLFEIQSITTHEARPREVFWCRNDYKGCHFTNT